MGAIAATGRSNSLGEFVHRSFLVFGVAFIALMAGALFYAARMPMEVTAPATVAEPAGTPTAVESTGPVYPEFALADLEGTTREMTEWAGKHRLLNFWATWCAPCRREIPLLKDFQEAHDDRVAGGERPGGNRLHQSGDGLWRVARDIRGLLTAGGQRDGDR